ncbi:MAG: hypothetical protein JXO22_17025, partial [Phycisphaerae bacterium]|nr:hypothetical protein [Phycisphaerae bacterium]
TGFVGPAFVPLAHPLARIEHEQNALWVTPNIGAPLLFSGPGAGPEVTAAAILDDVAEIATAGKPRRASGGEFAGDEPITCQAPVTPWLLRFTFDGNVPSQQEVSEFLGSHGIWFSQAGRDVRDNEVTVRHGLVHTAPRLHVELALSALRHATGCATHAIRALEYGDV